MTREMLNRASLYLASHWGLSTGRSLRIVFGICTTRWGLLDKDGLAEDDHAAMVHDRLLFPAPTHNHRGEPRWAGSEAETCLKLDIDEQKHEMIVPLQLYFKVEQPTMKIMH